MTTDQIIEDITARIESGELEPGDRLPTYADLRTLYSVGHGTAARVILLLKERGLVVGLHGKGVYVAERKKEQ
jgi:GntR family transcriptional regulator